MLTGNVILADLQAAKIFAERINRKKRAKGQRGIKPSHINALGLIDEVLHYVLGKYHREKNPDALKLAFDYLNEKFGKEMIIEAIKKFVEVFPPLKVYQGKKLIEDYLKLKTYRIPNLLIVLEEMLLLYLANENPAFTPFRELFDDKILEEKTKYREVISALGEFFKTQPSFGPDNQYILDLLRSPVIAAPTSLTGQLLYIKDHWGLMLSPELLNRLLRRLLVSLDFIREEEKPTFLGPGPTVVPQFSSEIEFYREEECFSRDADWMSNVVMIAKHTYVWLFQLSKKYGREINRLDEIPDEEFDVLANWGINTLWFIGVWERSKPSQKIKQLSGNPEAIPSAYSIYDYEIADELGGEKAFNNLKQRAERRGIKLAVDIVPNHTGIYSRWILEHPDWFIQLRASPFPSYKFTGPNLSEDDKIEIYIEDGYWNRTDAAVVFKLVDKRTREIRYIYHGNDGTSMPWNDTAQLNFLSPEVREAVIQKILNVAKRAHIIRLDAAMTLTKLHYHRLWFPEPGTGGDIPSRSESGMSKRRFNKLFPNEFWREVTDRIAKEIPDTMLLAEAFWLMEGYFVRSLGIHRVYNSAFMNMLKMEENWKYRNFIKNVLEFNPEILKRFVNFMSNPDEMPTIYQFGKGDKYLGVVMMMVTMPGLPMFGHGQVEGFSEKYGMEYKRSYWDEKIDGHLVKKHEEQIFPLLKKRYLFSGVADFFFYDFLTNDGLVNEDVFVYSNRFKEERALVLYNNKYQKTSGWVRISVSLSKEGKVMKKTLGQGLDIKKDYCYIFKDQVANLQYIREGREFFQKGFFVELAPYQFYVFIEFKEIKDNEAGDYKRLTAFLDGRGVPDINEAIKEMNLSLILNPFKEIMNVEMLHKIETYECQELFRQRMNNLLSSLKKFLNAEGDEMAVCNYLEDIWKIILFDLDNTVNKYSEMLRSRIKREDRNIILFIWLIVHAMARIKRDTNYEQESALWLDELFLGKIIQRVLQNLGHDEGRAKRETLLIKILTNFATIFRGNKERGKRFLEDEWVKTYINVHIDEGIVWFNKEGFEDLINWLFIISAIKAIKDLGADTEELSLRIRQYYEIAENLINRAQASAYRYEQMVFS